MLKALEQLEMDLGGPVEGDCRIVRSDKFNFSVERYARIKSKDKSVPDSYEWKHDGWYGHNLPMACQMAFRNSVQGGDTRELLESVKRAEARIMAYAEEIRAEARENA